MPLTSCSEYCWLSHLTLTFGSECSERYLVSQRKLVIIQSDVQLSLELSRFTIRDARLIASENVSFNNALLDKLVGIVFLQFPFLLPKVTELRLDKPLNLTG